MNFIVKKRKKKKSNIGPLQSLTVKIPFYNNSFYCYKEARLMAVTLLGPTGPVAASLAEKGLRSVFARATIPRRQTVEWTAGDWVKL